MSLASPSWPSSGSGGGRSSRAFDWSPVAPVPAAMAATMRAPLTPIAMPLARTMPLPYASSFPSPYSARTSTPGIRTSHDSDAGLRRPATSRAAGEADLDDQGERLLWGRSPTSGGAAVAVTRLAAGRTRRHIARPSTREPIRQFHESIATLPVLRDARAAEYAGLAIPHSAGVEYSPRSPALPAASASSLPGSPSAGAAFSRALLARHCGSFMVASLADAHDCIGAQRLELDLLRRLNDSLAHPGRGSAGTAVEDAVAASLPPFSEANFALVCLENTKLRELLEANTYRHDANTLALEQRARELAREAEALALARAQVVALRTEQASLEQRAANSSFRVSQLERSLTVSETQCTSGALEVQTLGTQLQELANEHVLCAAFKKLLEEEREELKRAAEVSRKEQARLSSEREALSAACATAEGRALVQLEVLASLRAELKDLKADRSVVAEARAKQAEELSAVRVKLVQADGSASRTARELADALSQLARAGEELTRTAKHANDDAVQASAALAAHRTQADVALAEARLQLSQEQQRAQEHASGQSALIESLRAELVAMTAANATATDEHTELTRANAALSARALEQKTSSATSHAKIVRLREELREAKAALVQAQQAETKAQADDADRADLLRRLREQEARMRELAVDVMEADAAAELARRAHLPCSAALARAEAATEREASLRRIQLKSAREVRRKLEGTVAALEVKAQALAKALKQAGASDKFATPPPQPQPASESTESDDDRASPAPEDDD